MATSLQERLKLKLYQVDTWTTREQLCLASAVLRSGDQNWVAVRRNIKMLTTEHSRPPDWYSTKNCALQYAKLLECVDTPKRRRERGDASNETPGEIVTKMLTKQRIDELTSLVAEEKASYNQQRREIQELESGCMDHQLDALWEQLLKERAEEEEEERRHQQWLKEREEKITAIQQALKHQGPKVHLPPNKKKIKPPWPTAPAGGARRNSGMSETSSELDSAVDSPDVQDTTVDNAGQDVATPEPETKPTPTSPLLSSLLNKSPILPGAATSPLSQVRSMRPGAFSSVSMALQNLVSSAISGTDSVAKSTTPLGPGSSTLSRLLDLPPSTPGGPLPRLSDLPTSSYEQKDSSNFCLQEKLSSPLKSSKDKSCSQNAENSGCSSSTEIAATDIKQENASDRPDKDVVEKVEKGGGEGEEVKESSEVKEEVKEISKEPKEEIPEEPEKPSKNEKKSREMDGKESKFQQQDSDTKVKSELKKKDIESTESNASTSQTAKADEKVKTPKDRDSRRKEDKRKETSKEKDKKITEGECDINIKEEEDSRETSNKNETKDHSTTSIDIKDETLTDKNKLDDDDDDKVLSVIKESKYYKELENQSKKSDKEEFDQDNSESKDWTSEEEGNFPRSGKRKISGSDYIGYSSPFVTESAPTSPASTHYGDDPESERAYKSWKKPIMILWNEIAGHRFASIFLRPISDEQAPGYRSVVYRPMDLMTIKRNIESGVIRNTLEFQRDMMLMFLNAIMYNTSDHNVHQMAHLMMQDTISTIEEFLNTQMLARAEETPQKSLRRETRESSAKRSDDDLKRKRDTQDEKSSKKRR